jgi:LysR family hydrogen peroxide-inducible transcriptional activator
VSSRQSLVDRTKRSVVLAPPGLEIVERARQILQEGKELAEAARAEIEPLSGTLRMGVIPTVGTFCRPTFCPGCAAPIPHSGFT